LLVNNTATVKFQAGAHLNIYADGQMTLTNTQIVRLWSPVDTGGIISNWGTFSFTGAGTGNATEIDMPFLNYGSATFNGGQLTITHKSAYTKNVSAEMDGGSFTLKGGINLTLDKGYLQTGGLFSVADATPATLTVKANSVELDGGKVQLGTVTTFGTLTVKGGDVNFNGAEYDPKIQGGMGGAGQEDSITTDHSINLGISKLVVTTIGDLVAGQVWKILHSDVRIVGNFAAFALPFGVKAVKGPLDYELDS
jgi:hypothetical protein